jgi:hypothetical protein
MLDEAHSVCPRFNYGHFKLLEGDLITQVIKITVHLIDEGFGTPKYAQHLIVSLK